MSVNVTFCPPDENNLHENEVDITLYMVIKNTIPVSIYVPVILVPCNFCKNQFFINIILLGVTTCPYPLISCCHNSTLPKI